MLVPGGKLSRWPSLLPRGNWLGGWIKGVQLVTHHQHSNQRMDDPVITPAFKFSKTDTSSIFGGREGIIIVYEHTFYHK